MTPPDDVDQLVAQLKSLPLIESADLDQPFAAYDAFELVASAVLRAALVQVPESKRRGSNGPLFRRFVTEHFPVGRGRGNASYAKRLYDFRCDFVKDKRTGPFALIHNAPIQHLRPGPDGRPMLNLESLIQDFHEAVESLGTALRTSAEMRAVAALEVAQRHVSVLPLADFSASLSLTHSRTVATLSAKAASGTN